MECATSLVAGQVRCFLLSNANDAFRSGGWKFCLPFSLVVESRTTSQGGAVSRNSLLRSTKGAIVSRAPEDSQPKRDSAQGDKLSQVSGEGGRIN